MGWNGWERFPSIGNGGGAAAPRAPVETGVLAFLEQPAQLGRKWPRGCVREPPRSPPSPGLQLSRDERGRPEVPPASTLEQGVPEVPPGCRGRPKSEQMCSGGASGGERKTGLRTKAPGRRGSVKSVFSAADGRDGWMDGCVEPVCVWETGNRGTGRDAGRQPAAGIEGKLKLYSHTVFSQAKRNRSLGENENNNNNKRSFTRGVDVARARRLSRKEGRTPIGFTLRVPRASTPNFSGARCLFSL